jgi:hypothetical protein
MRSLFLFFALTYAVSWSFFTGAAAMSGAATALTAASRAVLLLGVIAPSLVALALTARADGRAGMRALLGGIRVWPTHARWYLFAVGYLAAIKLSAAVLHRFATGAWPPLGQTPLYLMAAAIMISTPVQAGEEIGWRGYALPRLAGHLGLPLASIVLGVIWACWHLPLFFMPAADTSGQSFPVYLVQVTALSVAMAWLYWRTDGSLLIVMLMHASVNNTKDIVPSMVAGANNPFELSTSLVAWLTVALLWIGAACFLVRMRSATLRSGWDAATGLRAPADRDAVASR